MSAQFDVAVIGAGPAGSAAALALAQGGARVALLERERLPRYKTCGGGLVPRALGLAGLDVSPVVERRFPIATLHLHDTGQRFDCRRPYPVISMAMRDRLDQHLACAAAAAGADLRAPCRVRGGSVERGVVRLDTDHGPLVAGAVIGADGALGDTARWAGWGWGRDDARWLAPALEYEVTVDGPTMERVGAEVRFDVGPVPWGYAWVFPKAERLSIGALSTRRGARDLRRYLEAYLAQVGVTRVRSMERHGYVIPIRPRRSLARGPVLLVGDAAGLPDPVTAEGISNALASGRLAAEAILGTAADPARLGAAYQASLARELLPELRRARAAAALLYDYPRLRNFLFRRMGQLVCEGIAGVFVGERRYRGALTAAARRLLRTAVTGRRRP